MAATAFEQASNSFTTQPDDIVFGPAGTDILPDPRAFPAKKTVARSGLSASERTAVSAE